MVSLKRVVVVVVRAPRELTSHGKACLLRQSPLINLGDLTSKEEPNGWPHSLGTAEVKELLLVLVVEDDSCWE